MKKVLPLILIFCLSYSYSIAQKTGNFEESIELQGTTHTLAYQVPVDYDSGKKYPLIVALHGCGGSGEHFRNSLQELAESLDAIVLCPDNRGKQMSGNKGKLITLAIEKTSKELGLAINNDEVYLTGFSCNGQETFKQGWDGVYPFAGIIPFNAWIPSTNADFNFDSKIPTCACIGTKDGSYKNNQVLIDQLTAKGGSAKLNVMPGIGHQWNFSSRDEELLECINWIRGLK